MVYIPDMTERYPEGMRMYYEHEHWDEWDDWVEDKPKKRPVLKYNGIVPYSWNGPYTVREIKKWGADDLWCCKTLQDARMVAVQYFKMSKRPDRTKLEIIRSDNPRIRYMVFNAYYTTKEGIKECLLYFKEDSKLTPEHLEDRLYYLKYTGEVGSKYKNSRSSTKKAKTR